MDVNLVFCESKTPEQEAGHHHIRQGPEEDEYLGLQEQKERKWNGCKTPLFMYIALWSTVYHID